MGKPDYAFKTAAFTVYAATSPGRYRAEPGGAELHLSLTEQQLPDSLLSPAMERAVMAWVMARGGRVLNLNGERREIRPQDLERLPANKVGRVVSIAPSNAEIVGALGATKLLVGVENSSDFPPEVIGLPRLGPDLAIDMEALQALKPDLVLASLSVPGMERNIAALDILGLPMLVLAPRNLKDIEHDLLRTGKLLGTEAQAAQALAGMRARLKNLAQHGQHQPALPVYLEWWPKPLYTPGRDCWSNELIALAGGRNVFGQLPGQSTEIQIADLVRADPALILVAWCGVPFHQLNPGRVLRRKGLEGVRAIREGRVHAIDESLLGRPGPRVVEGIEAIAACLAGVDSTVDGKKTVRTAI